MLLIWTRRDPAWRSGEFLARNPEILFFFFLLGGGMLLGKTPQSPSLVLVKERYE